jgi:hypothetical protein
MLDVIFIVTMLALYVASHLIVIGLAKLRGDHDVA